MLGRLGELLAATTLLAHVEPASVDVTQHLSSEDIAAVHVVQRDLQDHGISTHILLLEQFNESSCSVYLEMPDGLPQWEGVGMSAFTVGIDDNFDGILERVVTDEMCVSVSGRLVRATLKAEEPFDFPYE